MGTYGRKRHPCTDKLKAHGQTAVCFFVGEGEYGNGHPNAVHPVNGIVMQHLNFLYLAD